MSGLSQDEGGDISQTTSPQPSEKDYRLFSENGEKKKATRRSVACKSCHGLKVKCTPANPDDPAGPCIRCINSRRKCEINLNQPRKRRKRSEKLMASAENEDGNQNLEVKANKIMKKDEIISDLQAQIKMLKDELTQKKEFSPPNNLNGSSHPKNSPSSELPPLHSVPLHARTESMHPSELGSPVFVSKIDLEKEIIMLCESSSSSLSELTNSLKHTADKRNSLLKEREKIDLVSRGIITEEEAEYRLNLYQECIYKTHPLVEINEDVHHLRSNQPFLFNAIMSITNSVIKNTDDFDHSLIIDNEAMKCIAIEVLVAGSKSVELIKCILLLCLWYNTPELFRHRRYHLLNTLSVTLLHDVGIVARPSYSYKQSDGSVQLNEPNKSASIEYSGLLMTLYFTTVSICLILRRAIYVKWTPYVEECCVRLQESGIPKMKSLALFSRLSHELERIHHIVHSPDSNDKAGQSSRYIISELQKNLNTIKAQIDPQKHSFLAYYYSVEAYLHEPTLSESVTKALNSETDQDSFKLNTNTIMSIAQCTTSCLKALDSFTLMSPSEISALPIIYAARIIYTAGMLLRLRYLIISLPSHIEKDLVPRHAVFVIQKLTRSLDQAGIIHPANHFLKKLHLVLQLFVQTYATQVQDLLQKNGETPENLVPTNVYRVPKRDLEKLSDLYNRSHVGGLLTTESGKQYASQISLDLLSYAASVRRDGKSEPPSHLPKQVGSPLRIANDIQPQDSNERSTNKQYHVTNNSSSGDQRTLDDTTYFPNPKLKNRNTKIQGLYTSGSNLDPSLSTLRYSTPPSGLTTNQNVDLINTNSPTAFNNSNQLNANPPSFQHRGDVNGASSFNPVNSFNMPNPNPNLQFNGDIPIQDSSNPLAKHIANPDQLENSYLALNDEFWSDLLNADSNKLNFNNKSAGDNMNSEEFFFMQ